MMETSLRSLESLVDEITDLSRATGAERDALTLWEERLHIARNADNRIELFIEGDSTSFGPTAVGRALEYGRYTERRQGREFSALVVRASAGDVWVRPMSHLAYEAMATISRDPSITNEDLLAALEPYLKLVVDRQLLSIEQQMGFTGELIFLQELIDAASLLGASSQAALECWTGWDSATRDFKGSGIAVEVKSAGGDSRHHWVHPLFQLLPATKGSERVFVFSVGLRVDRSRAFRMTTAVQRILDSIPAASKDVFLKLAKQYAGVGFDMSQWRQYELEPGFLVTMAPTLYRVDELVDILRPESFRDARVPERVLDLSYRVSLEGLPAVSKEEREQILRTLLLA